ncbi:uncharacterized protein BP5553_01381 [Venustampulla echinocandica]|uniref:Putative gamma-glutamylcyclotransferase n=1 Tax=Venustampulla echinocandica TaxID=2656787 RepID=A0A370U0V1_9HELO|nr:uncharacterized protein BP5553_01381 [Venustampulla echinocandica]RDL41402.1 hypothetical protein BP5553_01381 [Venustampulla echinocandica]
MAANAAQPEEISDELSLKTIKQWQQLFGYSHMEAAELIKERRADFTRKRVSDSHWALVQSQMEPQWCDREAYEHMLELGGKAKKSTAQAKLSPAQARAVYILKLEGALDTPAKVEAAGGLRKIPQVFQGTGDDGDAAFCQVDGATKLEIESWVLGKKGLNFKPTFVRITKAFKELSPGSLYPTLGQDATLPHHRPLHLFEAAPTALPAQDQYPVWYFFYGTLADVTKLASVLSLPEGSTPLLHPATITNGKMQTWGAGKYNALVDGPEESRVTGSAFLVMTKEHEDFLRLYETDAYEVVRCTISMDSAQVPGCTFRYIGMTD